MQPAASRSNRHAARLPPEGVGSKARGYNLDIRNPHTVAEDRGDPETLLKSLAAAEAEAEAAALRDRLKAMLSEALMR